MQLKEVGDFYHKADAENQILINHKYFCLTLNRQFLLGAVMGWLFPLIHQATIILFFSI
jgi:hypothetical protein